MTETNNVSAVENICNVVGDNHTNLDSNSCKAVEIPSERDLKELNTSYNIIVNVFCNISHDAIEFKKLSEIFTQLTKNYHSWYTGLEQFVSSIELNAEKVDEYRYKITSIATQYKLMQRTFENAKREDDKESPILMSDLQVTAKKNVFSKKPSRCSSISTKLTGKSLMLSYKDLSPKQRAIVAESKLRTIEIEDEGRLQAAKIEANLTKRLADPDNYSSTDKPEVGITHGCLNRKHSMGNHVEYDVFINDKKRIVPHEVVRGGSSKHDVQCV